MHKIGVYNFLSKKDEQIEESDHFVINDHHVENKSECKYLDSILDLNLWFQLQVKSFFTKLAQGMEAKYTIRH